MIFQGVCVCVCVCVCVKHDHGVCSRHYITSTENGCSRGFAITIEQICDFNTMQHTATRCNTRQHAALCYSTLQQPDQQSRFRRAVGLPHPAFQCSTLHHTASHCSTLQHSATCCNTLHHTATYCNSLSPGIVDLNFVGALLWGVGLLMCHDLILSAQRCNTLQQAATCSNKLPHSAPQCNRLLQTAAHSNTGTCTIQVPKCNTLRYIATHYKTL